MKRTPRFMTSARRACVRKLIPTGASSVLCPIGPVSKTRLGPDRPFNQHTRVFAQTRTEKEAANVLKPEVTSERCCVVPTTTAISSNLLPTGQRKLTGI